MADFYEVTAQREDGTEATHLINLDSVGYIEFAKSEAGTAIGDLIVHMNDGYWFTLTGTEAQELVERIGVPLKRPSRDN